MTKKSNKTRNPGAAPLAPIEAIVTTAAPAPAPRTLPALTVAYNPALVQAGRVVALQAADFGECIVATEADAEACAEVLGGVVRAKDMLVAAQALALEGIKAQEKTVRGWFKDGIKPLEDVEETLKNQIGWYKIGLLEARDAAADAVSGLPDQDHTNDPAASLALIGEASDAQLAAESKIRGVSTTMTWQVDRVVPGLLLPEFIARAMTVEVVQAACKQLIKHAGEDQPIEPGVVFKRRAIVGAYRDPK
jgi:hypothetical protein